MAGIKTTEAKDRGGKQDTINVDAAARTVATFIDVTRGLAKRGTVVKIEPFVVELRTEGEKPI
jgi:hypothetical protein